MAIPGNTTDTTVKDDTTKTEMPIPKGSQVNTNLGNRFSTSNYRNTINYNQGGGGQNNLDLDKEMLNQVDYSMGGPQGNEFMDEDGNIIGYGPSYGDKDSIDLTPSFDMFAKYDDEQSVALAAETISGQKELGVTTYNIDGTVSTVPPGLDKSDTPTAQEQAAADKAAEKAAMSQELQQT